MQAHLGAAQPQQQHHADGKVCSCRQVSPSPAGKVRSISNASPEFRQLTPLPEYGNGTDDDLQLSYG